MKEIVGLMPGPIRTLLSSLPPAVRDHLEEIRLRQQQPLEIRYMGSRPAISLRQVS
ncbi:UNVERIFIED_CONTAM: stage III sporulation protein SpoIIIAA [Brevibacillus sp. OAP136]